MNATISFTPESVQATLLAADFPEYTEGLEGHPGFTIGDGRARGEIIVQHRFGRMYNQPGDDEKFLRYQEAYETALRQAGFEVHIENPYVLVTGIRED